jgi:hypothetical protein
MTTTVIRRSHFPAYAQKLATWTQVWCKALDAQWRKHVAQQSELQRIAVIQNAFNGTAAASGRRLP